MDVATALGAYLDVVDGVAPGLVEGVYVVGSYALGDWHEGRSDIDVVAVTADPATDEDAGALLTAHAILAERLPEPAIDGPYLAWGDLTVAPTSLHRPWASGGALHHDAECVDINPVTWYVLATYGVTVRGPAAEELTIDTDRDLRVRFAADSLQAWRPVAERLRAAAADPERPSVGADVLERCVLPPLQLHHTATTGDVTSKSGAASYGFEVAPARFMSVIADALAARHGTWTANDVSAEALHTVADLIAWGADDVRRAGLAP